MNNIITKIKDFLSGPYGIGKKVFWDNPVDHRFREIYEIVETEDKHGRVGVYNKDKGKRYAYRFELIPYDQYKKEKP